MQFEIPTQGVLHLKFESQEAVCRAMIRLQEYYESPREDIRGHIVSRGYILQRFSQDKHRSYYTEWNGFNVPGHIVREFFEKAGDNLTPEERLMLPVIRTVDDGNGGNPFYLIATHRAEEISHELAHALYYLDPEYEHAADLLLFDWALKHDKLSDDFRAWLIKRGYCEAVLEDEANAYLSTTPEAWWREHAPELAEELSLYCKPFEDLFHEALTSEPDDLGPRLRVAVEGDEIVIRLPLETMAFAAARAPFVHHVSGCPEDTPPDQCFRVTDPAVFAAEVVRALEFEDEDGTTPVHDLFDDAFEHVVDDGGEGYVWPAAGFNEGVPHDDQEAVATT